MFFIIYKHTIISIWVVRLDCIYLSILVRIFLFIRVRN